MPYNPVGADENGNLAPKVKARLDDSYINPVTGIKGDTAILVGSSTADGLASGLSSMLADFGITLDRRAARGSHQMSHHAAILGTRPMQIAAVTIPASGSVAVVPKNMPEGNNTALNFPALPVKIEGVAGTLASPAASAVWTFTRAASGDVVYVPDSAVVIPTATPANRNSLALLTPGKNSLTATAPSVPDWDARRVIGMTERMYDYCGGADGNVLVIGHFVNSTYASGWINRTNIETFNAHFKATLGDRFFDLNAYVTSAQVWTDTGVTPTPDDLTKQSNGVLPLSLSRDGGTHLTDATEAAVVSALRVKMLAMGWLSAATATYRDATDTFSVPGPIGATTTGGYTWASLSGPLPVAVGGVVKPGAAAGLNLAVIPRPGDASSKYRVSAKIASIGDGTAVARNAGIAVRVVDASNYFWVAPRLNASNPSGYALWKRMPSGVAMVKSVSTVPTAGQEMAIEVNESTNLFRVFLDGVEMFSETDAALSGQGNVGIRFDAGVGGQALEAALDNFSSALL